MTDEVISNILKQTPSRKQNKTLEIANQKEHQHILLVTYCVKNFFIFLVINICAS